MKELEHVIMKCGLGSVIAISLFAVHLGVMVHG